MCSIFNLYFKLKPTDSKSSMSTCIAFIFVVSLVDVDVGNTSTRYSRFANYLRNLLPAAGDTAVMEMAAGAVGRLALASGTYSSEYVEYESKRAFEWLSGDRNEGKRHAAVIYNKLIIGYST